MSYKPVALFILDGWGIREMEHGNAVVQANTPNFDHWKRSIDRSIVDASGEAVGLVPEQMGNSEVGHLNLGAGFIVYQDITRIDRAIGDGSFFQHPTLLGAIEQAKQQGKKVHYIGLLGPGGVHSATRHLMALLEMAKRQGIEPVLHIITDGRDTPPNSGLEFVGHLEQALAGGLPGVIADVSGRYYAMDRDKRWERTQRAYDAMLLRQGERAASATQAVQQFYATGKGDEFILPTVIDVANESRVRMEGGDAVVFFNFRADRMRQIVAAFILDDFDGFARPDPRPRFNAITFTEYATTLPTHILFPHKSIHTPLARVIADHGGKQFHAAETEKYAHMTYFFNGGREQPFEGEDRALIPSPKVATYDLQPEMSAYQLTETVLERIRTHDDDFILVNFANPDMVGHTGVLAAAKQAIEVVDECAGRLVKAVNDKGGVAIVTADHGNAEIMIDELTGEPHTYHTTNPVSLFVLGDRYFPMRPRGILADVAPTVLHLLGLPQPEVMTGVSLVALPLAVNDGDGVLLKSAQA